MKNQEKGLTVQQIKFCNLLRADPDRSSWKAYLAAYPSCKSVASARTNATRLLKNATIARFMAEADREALAEAKIDGDKVTQIKAAIATFDPRRLVHANGTPKELHELDDETAAALEEMTISVEIDKETGAMRKVAKYKWAKKAPIVDQLSRQFGQYERDNRQGNKGMDDLLRRVDGKTRGLPGQEEGDDDE